MLRRSANRALLAPRQLQATAFFPALSHVVSEQGEGPVWDHRSHTFLWVDIVGQNINAYNPANHQLQRCFLTASDDIIGFALPTTKQGVLLCGSQNGLFTYNIDTGRRTVIEHPEEELTENRFNDAKTDGMGNAWVGSMHRPKKQQLGSLYRTKGAKSTETRSPLGLEKFMSEITVSNGLDWSPDHKTFYHIDTPTKQIKKYPFRIDGITASEGEVVYKMKDGEGLPDGMCADASGNLWIACVTAGKVICVDPSAGNVVAEVHVPTKLVTSCCFGGEKHDQLIITTARGLTPADAEKCTCPNAGRLYVCNDTGVCGMPMHPAKCV